WEHNYPKWGHDEPDELGCDLLRAPRASNRCRLQSDPMCGSGSRVLRGDSVQTARKITEALPLGSTPHALNDLLPSVAPEPKPLVLAQEGGWHRRAYLRA